MYIWAYASVTFLSMAAHGHHRAQEEADASSGAADDPFGLTGAGRRADREAFVENVAVVIMILDPNQDGNVDRDEWPAFRQAIQLNLRA